MKGSAAKIQMSSLDDLFGGVPAQAASGQIQEIPLAELHPFKDHPFHVVDDEKMREMAESVAQYGVLVPGIVRPRPEGGYELVAGHRRKRASELAGKETMPVIVRELDDDEAIIIMVDSNLQREKILPSEKAYAYKLKLEALKHQGRRTDLTSDPMGPKFRSNEKLAEQSPDGITQIKRYIRLTQLIPALLNKVDDNKLAFRPAVELSYLSPYGQSALLEWMENQAASPSLKQAQRLKEYSKTGELTAKTICAVLSGSKPKSVQITLRKKCLSQYFPKEYTQRQMEEVILSLLETWKFQQKGAEPNDHDG